jgi:CubicO group peptidase (beta-lactamase class C family)
MRQIGGEEVKFGWGYGGQMVYIVPSLGMTVVMTSDESGPSARNGYRDQLHALLSEIIGVAQTT